MMLQPEERRCLVSQPMQLRLFLLLLHIMWILQILQDAYLPEQHIRL